MRSLTSCRCGITSDVMDSMASRTSIRLCATASSREHRRSESKSLRCIWGTDAPRARLAVDAFCYRSRKYLGAYLAVLGGARAVIFSGGIGENVPLIREKICAGMEWCGLTLDKVSNFSTVGVEACISGPDSGIQAYVIPSDEEALIARETARLVVKTNT